MPENTDNMEATTNKKKDNTALYIVYATAAYFGLQFLMKPKRAAAATIKKPVSSAAPATNTGSGYNDYVPEVSKWIAESFPLRKGMKGNNIKALQKKLGISADGAFGDKTESTLLQQYGISTVSQAQFKTITAAQSTTPSTPAQSTSATKWIAESFPLRKGMKGNNIKAIQQKLGVPSDGAFGNNTEAALLQQHGTNTISIALFQSIMTGNKVIATTANTNTSTPATKWVAESFPLRIGMKGNNIKVLQQHLGVSADGAFGNNTETALLQRYGLKSLTQAQFQIFTGKNIATNNTATPTNVPVPSGTPVKWIAERFPLQYGMKGNNVKLLQEKLGVPADGAFGLNTQARLLLKYGASSVDQTIFQRITQAKPAVPSIMDILLPKSSGAGNTIILKSGSKGQDVYRLQKWLGFKDKNAAKKGELIADSIFGKQTLTALQKKTGKATITVGELNTLTKQISGIGYLGEPLITKRNATVFDNQLQPYRNVPENTILGTRTMELKDPAKQKAYTQFRTVEGIRRWIESDAL